jgi:hypothetical protein
MNKMFRPDTPLAETLIPKPLKDFSPYERKIMASMKKDPRFMKENIKRFTKEESDFYQNNK